MFLADQIAVTKNDLQPKSKSKLKHKNNKNKQYYYNSISKLINGDYMVDNAVNVNFLSQFLSSTPNNPMKQTKVIDNAESNSNIIVNHNNNSSIKENISNNDQLSDHEDDFEQLLRISMASASSRNSLLTLSPTSPQIVQLAKFLSSLRCKVQNVEQILPYISSFVNSEIVAANEVGEVISNLSGNVSKVQESEWNNLHSVRRQRVMTNKMKKLTELRDISENLTRTKFPPANLDFLHYTSCTLQYLREKQQVEVKMYLTELFMCIRSHLDLVAEITAELHGKEKDAELISCFQVIKSLYSEQLSLIDCEVIFNHLKICGMPEDLGKAVQLSLSSLADKIAKLQSLLGSRE